MQTFLAYPVFTLSAQCLDTKRLGKQRVECAQMLNALGGTVLKLDGTPYGYPKSVPNHPATRMWRNYEQALALYGLTVCREWKMRGYVNNIDFLPSVGGTVSLPLWLGDTAFHRSHRSNLIRKLPEHYGKLWPDVPNDLPYVWPTSHSTSPNSVKELNMIGLGVLIAELGRDQVDHSKFIGRTIKSALLTEDELRVQFTDGSAFKLFDDGQSCCESRYITCDDDVTALAGQKLLHIIPKTGPTEDAEWDTHETMFVEVQTDGGFVTLTTHNEHNGYYGGFALRIEELPSNSVKE